MAPYFRPVRAKRRALRGSVALAAAIGCAVALAGPAFAHVDADPLAVQAGTPATVGFPVEHGCDGSPTTGLKLQFPDGYTALKPVDKAGWTSAVAGNVVTFSGGPLAPTRKESFAVSLTAPTAAATTYVPIVQTCVKGELDWITIPEDGKPEPDHPAAMVKITAGVPTAADLAAPADDPAMTDATAKKSSSSHTGLYVGLGVGVVVVVGGLLAMRRMRQPKTT